MARESKKDISFAYVLFLYGDAFSMHGCMAAWLHGCMAAWLHGCMAAWLHG